MLCVLCGVVVGVYYVHIFYEEDGILLEIVYWDLFL